MSCWALFAPPRRRPERSGGRRRGGANKGRQKGALALAPRLRPMDSPFLKITNYSTAFLRSSSLAPWPTSTPKGCQLLRLPHSLASRSPGSTNSEHDGFDPPSASFHLPAGVTITGYGPCKFMPFWRASCHFKIPPTINLFATNFPAYARSPVPDPR